MAEDLTKLTENDRSRWMFIRVISVFIILLLFALGGYGFEAWLYNSLSSGGITITLSMLFGLPFSLGALSAYALGTGSKNELLSVSKLLLIYTVGILLLGGLILREGVICLAMISPIWIISATVGIRVIKKLHKKFDYLTNLHCSIFIALPFILSMMQGYFPENTQVYTVSRSVVINMPVEKIWPSLLSLPEIDESEGQWNISQSLLRIPRPSSAIVKDYNGMHIRHAKWGKTISFEEHITTWDLNSALRWNFVFPNDSIHQHTDRHISPDGAHLKIIDGGYTLKALSPEQTEITLDTVYSAKTPINAYSALWGELILGDIQNNILKIIKTRNETSAPL